VTSFLLCGSPKAWVRFDIVAGITAAAVVLPQAIAYATVAGLPLQYGLYCALVPAAVYAFLGSSRALSVSTTSSISLLTAAAIARHPHSCAADRVTRAHGRRYRSRTRSWR
jgi:SulP family sulfate permease